MHINYVTFKPVLRISELKIATLLIPATQKLDWPNIVVLIYCNNGVTLTLDISGSFTSVYRITIAPFSPVCAPYYDLLGTFSESHGSEY